MDLTGQLGDALRAVASWQVERGRLTDRPFIAVDLTGAPPEVAAAGRMLRELNYGCLVERNGSSAPEVAGPDDPAGPSFYSVLAAFWDALSERDAAVIVERVVQDPPTTLQVLGARYGVSHQRIAQIEAEMRRRLDENMAPGTYFGTMIGSLVEQLPPLIPLADLVEQIPVLGSAVPGTGLTTWQLLGSVIPGIEVEGQWAGVPTIAAVRESTRRIVRESASYPGVTRVGRQRQRWPYGDDLLRDWLTQCGLVSFLDYIVEPAANATEAITQALLMTDRPQSLEQISGVLDQLGTPRARSTLSAALRDPRFVRADGGGWCLQQRALTYVDLLDEVGQRVDAAGSVALTDFDEELAAHGVPRECLEAFAAHGEFKTVDGRILRVGEPGPLAFAPVCAPGVYRVDDGWGSLTTLRAENVATGEIRVSTGIAVALGLSWPTRHPLAGLPGAELVWKHSEVLLRVPPDALRPFQIGGRLFAWVSDDGAFALRDAAPDAPRDEPLARAVNHIGQTPTGSEQDDLSLLAAAVEAPADADIEHLLVLYFRKREFEVVADLAEASGTVCVPE